MPAGNDRPLLKTRLRLIGKAKEDEPENRRYHAMLVQKHCAIKGAQAGSLLTLIASPPILLLLKNKPGFILSKTLTACTYGVVIGTVATSAMAYNILRKASDEAVFDRAYRLTYNESQNRSDVFSLAGAAGMAMLAFRLPMSYGPAACAGIGLGVVAHCAYKPFAKREP